jgi:predicted esterase
MRTISIEARTHGRVLLREAKPSSGKRLLVGFHGYAQGAEDMMSELERVPENEEWTILSVQALHRFYSKGQERVVASWMTRQDRELAISDNVEYVNRAIAAVLAGAREVPIVFVGFSQGVAMAYRAAITGAHRARQVVAVGGDLPPDVRSAPLDRFPSILIAAGDADTFYTSAKLEADELALRSLGATFEVFRYAGGHEWTEDLRIRVRRVLEECAK